MSDFTQSILLLDSRMVETMVNAKLEPGKVEKHSQNPLFMEEFFADPPKNWEARYDNLYPTVLFDEEEGVYKLWYHTFLVDSTSNETPLAKRPFTEYRGGQREDGVLYAISKDGIHWEKPNLGIIPFNSSAENNIVMSLKSHGVHSGGVIKEAHDPDPNRRYKYFHRNPGARRMAVSFSADGLHWSQPILWPEHDAVGDSHNNALWAPELGRYVGFTRGWSERPYHGIRTLLRTESNDFIHWSEPVEIMRGADEHDQIYSMPVFRYKDLYLGLPAQFHKGNPDAPDWDTVTTELAWSADTINWQRICPGQPFIPLGPGEYPDGAYDCGCIYAAAPVIQGDDILLYYGGSNGLHNGWREGSFNLATFPKDRFAGYLPNNPGHTATVRTTRLVAQEMPLSVNVDIQSNGWLRVAVLDSDGIPLAGYGLDDCHPLQAGGLAVVVQWQSKDLSALAGKRIQLMFEFNSAKLFAYSGCVVATKKDEVGGW
jgi:hypothetical protein